MTKQELGRLERVDLRQFWTREDTEFTPWLAQDQNISLLGETIGVELEVLTQEASVGAFRADILCQDVGSNAKVLIKNQIEVTDHKHLGQLLTYAAGLETVYVVWIAQRFTEEHRAALDWLNNRTDDGAHFFGIEVELLKIGDSPAAPRFNLVSQPNEWSKSIRQAVKESNTYGSRYRDLWADY